MANMTDQNTGGNNLVNKLMQALYTSSASFTITPGTGGGSAFTITPPFHLRLMTAVGSNATNGTEATATNCPGYAAGGVTMGTTAFAAPSAGVSASSNAQSWTATAAWSAVTGIEIWDTAATALRYLQGGITPVTLANGNTLQFPAGQISASAAAW